MANEQVTGTRDEHYDLISVAYHAMHGAWNYDRFIHDAEESGDQDLADFFRQVKDEDAQRGERAKQLLAKRLS